MGLELFGSPFLGRFRDLLWSSLILPVISGTISGEMSSLLAFETGSNLHQSGAFFWGKFVKELSGIDIPYIHGIGILLNGSRDPLSFYSFDLHGLLPFPEVVVVLDGLFISS